MLRSLRIAVNVLFWGLVALPCVLSAQAEFRVSGKLTESNSSLPCISAQISLQDLPQIAAMTDENGSFILTQVPAGKHQLKITNLGFKTLIKSIEVNGDLKIDLQLESSPIDIKEVTIESGKNHTQSSSFLNVDKQLRPVNSAQDLLQLVPGLFIAQHAGGGKAEQIFLRGFDNDHGTDFYIALDGMPVNMVSHAHGQGYADFHFVIPETVDRLAVFKGPYTTRFGDFSTSGTGEFSTKNGLDQSILKAEVGMFNTFRTLGMVNLLSGAKTGGEQQAFVAAEYVFTNSYFDKKQNFKRYNLFGKYYGKVSPNSYLQGSMSTFDADWSGSGQVPQRAVDMGIISRYGQIDSFEGGHTSRTNFNAILSTYTAGNGLLKNQLYYTKYDFSLFSNFTFFLNDPVNGDEIHQLDDRTIIGYNGSFQKETRLAGRSLNSSFGLATRHDFSNVALIHTTRRTELEPVVSGRLHQANVSSYADFSYEFASKWMVNVGSRLDVFSFDFDHDGAGKDPNRTLARISPKLNLYYQANSNSRFFVKSGIGFHSNDARSVVLGQTENSLPKAFGYETGTELKLGSRALLQAAVWALHSQSELVYVGDEGVVETSGATRRVGLDFGLRYQIVTKIFADFDFNYNHGRLVGQPKGANYIPLAPRVTSTGGVQYKQDLGFNASLRYRILDKRPANEDNSIIAKGYTVLDAAVLYATKRFDFGITIENVLNTEWNQAQFDTTSRLFNENQEVSELHFTPGTPFFLKGSVTFKF